MRKHSCLGVVIAITAGLLSCDTVTSVRAQTAQPQAGGTAGFDAPAAAVGRIAKFVTATTVGNSLLFERNGRIGLGTASPFGTFDITGKSPSLNVTGSEPVLMLRDTSAGRARSFIRSTNGGLSLLGEDQINKSNPLAFVRIERSGKVGLGTSDPQRLLQIGPDTSALFTIEASDASPRAGFIRFGDNTGWQLRIGRSRESSGGPLNTGLTGALFTFRDDGAFGPTAYPLLATGVEPLCRTLANFITRCEASSLRYKKDIEPYRRGLDAVAQLQPIAFTRIYNGRSDVGLAAEDVEKIDPRFTYPNERGEVEGVKYQLLTTVLINAVKEQQTEIEELRSAVERLEKLTHLLSTQDAPPR